MRLAQGLLLFRTHSIEICIARYHSEEGGEREQPRKAHHYYSELASVVNVEY